MEFVPALGKAFPVPFCHSLSAGAHGEAVSALSPAVPHTEKGHIRPLGASGQREQGTVGVRADIQSPRDPDRISVVYLQRTSNGDHRKMKIYKRGGESVINVDLNCSGITLGAHGTSESTGKRKIMIIKTVRRYGGEKGDVKVCEKVQGVTVQRRRNKKTFTIQPGGTVVVDHTDAWKRKNPDVRYLNRMNFYLVVEICDVKEELRVHFRKPRRGY